MKIGSISTASIILLVFGLISFITKLFFRSAYTSLFPYYNGALIGAMCMLAIQHASVYINAWIYNRKESNSQRN